MKKKKKSAKSFESTQESAPMLARILDARTNRCSWRSTVARVRYIHEQARTGKYPNCTKVAKKYGVSTRTIDRDILAMRESMELPLEFDFVKNGYYYTREVPRDLPRPRLTAGDTIAFSLAKRALERFRGTDFAALFEEALRKIMDEVEGEVPLEWEELDKYVSFGPTGGAKISDVQIAGAVSDALLRERELTLEYRNSDGKKHVPRRLQPLHLRAFEDSLLLFALDPQKADGVVRRFVLSRMRNARATEQEFARPANFDADEEMKHSVGAYRGGKPERVRLGLSEFAARFLEERPLHHSQRIVLTKPVTAKSGKRRAKARPADEQVPEVDPHSPEYCRYAELTMEVAVTPELEQKILRWGLEVEVQEPTNLRDKITQIAAVIVARSRRRSKTGGVA